MNRTYRPGDYLCKCDRTGFTVYASDTVVEWNGLRVRRQSAERRQPQDFVRGRKDNQSVPDARPQPADVFLYTNGEQAQLRTTGFLISTGWFS